MAKKVYTRTFTHQTTTSGVANGVWTIAMPSNALWSVAMVCIANDTTGGNERAQYRRHMLAYRKAGGAATIQGATETVGTDVETNATLDATLGVSGNDIGSSVTGLAATTLDWVFCITIVEAP